MSGPDPSKVEHSVTLPPTLAAYYANHKLKPDEFLKAVRVAKIKAFQGNDIESARAGLAEKDPDLSRTLALGVGVRAPETIERWVVDAARHALRSIEPNILLEENESAEAIFGRILEGLADNLRSDKKAIRSRAQNLVKLSLNWLIRRRSLDPLQALYAFSRLPRKLGALEAARSEAQRALLRAKPGQWRTLSLVASLSLEEVKEADRNRNQALRGREQLQARLAELGQQLESKDREAATLSSELKQLKDDLNSAKHEVEAQRRLRNLDAAEAAGRTRNLLAGRLSLLLSDARDALEFEPPDLEAARERIDAARETIAHEVNLK